jgi:chromosome partitioning protein
MHTIAIANIKGGTGKTATCHALGAVLANEHRRHVLLVDCDPQSSLTGACGVRDAAGASLAEALGRSFNGTLELFMYRIIVKVQPGLDLVPADIALARAEQGLLRSNAKRSLLLREALHTVGVKYDVALLDCPPNLGLMTMNALAAADAVLIPTTPNVLDLRALRLFLSSLQEVRQRLNPHVETLGILLTFFDGRLNHHKRIVHALRGLGLPLLDVTVGRSIRVAEASNASQSIVDYAPTHKQAEAYRQVGAVVDRWLVKPRSPLRWLRE